MNVMTVIKFLVKFFKDHIFLVSICKMNYIIIYLYIFVILWMECYYYVFQMSRLSCGENVLLAITEPGWVTRCNLLAQPTRFTTSTAMFRFKPQHLCDEVERRLRNTVITSKEALRRNMTVDRFKYYFQVSPLNGKPT